MNLLARAIATVFGSGRVPLAPGTFASFLAVLAYKYLLSGLSGPARAGTLAAIFLAGLWASGAHSAALGLKDPRPVVIDEVCGQWISLLFVPPAWGYLAGGFLLFRVFDVLKPFPIRRLESLPGGWGIMADDVLAGLYAAAVLRIAYLVL